MPSMLSSFMHTKKQLLNYNSNKRNHYKRIWLQLNHADSFKLPKKIKKKLGYERFQKMLYLGPGSSSIEKGRRCMSKPSLGHQMIRSYSSFNIILVDPNRNPHQHVLWPFNYFSMDILRGKTSQEFWSQSNHIQGPDYSLSQDQYDQHSEINSKYQK